MDILLLLFSLALVVNGAPSSPENQDKVVQLESYNVDPDEVSLSGLSSGGSFANNIMVAHSAFLYGAASFAGGAYHRGSTEDRIDHARANAEAGLVDPVENLEGKPFYVFAGGNDGSAQNSAPIIRDFFEGLGAVVAMNTSNTCGHGTPSLDSGIDCPRTWLPGVNNCGWSGAYHIMEHIHGGLQEPTPHMTPLKGDFMEFDQTEFTQLEISAFADTGYVYIPSGCRDRTTQCRLHVSVHGCFHLSWVIGDKYARMTGHNEVGELNDFIILHPMLTSSIIAPPNVFGCWSSGAGADTNEHVDIRVVMKMIHRILGTE